MPHMGPFNIRNGQVLKEWMGPVILPFVKIVNMISDPADNLFECSVIIYIVVAIILIASRWLVIIDEKKLKIIINIILPFCP